MYKVSYIVEIISDIDIEERVGECGISDAIHEKLQELCIQNSDVTVTLKEND